MVNSLTNLESYASVKKWFKKLESRSADFSSSSTKPSALHWLQAYCRFLKVNPDTLIADRTRTSKSADKAMQRKHEEFIDDFIIDLRRNGKSPNTISTAVGLIRSFYKWNYEELKGATQVKIYKVRHFKVPTVKEIAKMCKIANLPTKAWICCQKDSGLANVDLLSLKWDAPGSEFGTIKKQLKRQLKKKAVPIHVKTIRHKTQERIDTFFGPNAIDALKEHLNFRKYKDPRLFKMTERAFQKSVKTLAIRANVATEKMPITPYSLRKFFNTTMKYIAKVPESVVERWMGHSIGRVKSAYSVVGSDDISIGLPISKMAETYMEAYKHIDIS